MTRLTKHFSDDLKSTLRTGARITAASGFATAIGVLYPMGPALNKFASAVAGDGDFNWHTVMRTGVKLGLEASVFIAGTGAFVIGLKGLDRIKETENRERRNSMLLRQE